MAAAALQEAPPQADVDADTTPRVTFASTLEVGLYVRWRRALDGDDAVTVGGASAAEEAARDGWWQEIVREYTSPVRR